LGVTAGLDAPRAPSAVAGARLYESHYLTAVDPRGGRALWLRYTALKAPAEPAQGTLWCTFFDAAAALGSAARPIAPGPAGAASAGTAARPIARRTAAPQRLGTPGRGNWAEIDGATIGPGHAEGALQDCRWSLLWKPQPRQQQPLPYLPSSWLYDRRLPRSNGAAVAPSARFAGEAEIAGTHLDLSGWRGMVGHNWGSDHADRWIWLHAFGLGPRNPDGWLDLVLARVRVGPALTPWLPAGAVCLDGIRRRVGALAARGIRVEQSGERLTVAIPRIRGAALRLEAESPAAHTARWDYASPDGGRRDVSNCSIATATIRLGAAPEFVVNRAFAVEIGG
jgi:hypothetical protein